ncbi:MAG: winged helix-turn-helix domain-containing protein [Myxococcota bacterium]
MPETPEALYIARLRGAAHASADAEGEWPWVFRTLRALEQGNAAELRAARRDEGWLALRHLVLDAAIRFDLERLDAIVALPASSSLAKAVQCIGFAWRALLQGRWTAEGHRVLEQAPVPPAPDPGLPIERVCLLALGHLALGEGHAGLQLARRASRQAASEGILQMEYLANLALARARRYAGDAHLARTILRDLRRVVPPSYSTWVELEARLAGTRPRTFETLPPLLEGELRCLRAMGGQGVDELAESWCTGALEVPPFGLGGAWQHPLFAAAWVHVPGSVPRRRLIEGLSDVPLFIDAAGGGRLRSAVAVLAVHSRPLPASRLFASVYGFESADEGHEQLLRQLLLRLRRSLESVATLERGDAGVSLRADAAFAVPDPSSERTVDQRILAHLASGRGRATAKEIAEGVGVPLRTVQRALGDLVDDGRCAREADGRRKEYVLEDTTFSEPTLHRLRGLP